MEDRHVQALLEDINSKFKAIQEYVADIPGIKSDIALIKEDIGELKEDMIIVKQSLKNKANIERVEKIEADVKILQQKIA